MSIFIIEVLIEGMDLEMQGRSVWIARYESSSTMATSLKDVHKESEALTIEKFEACLLRSCLITKHERITSIDYFHVSRLYAIKY